jgi:hypothetical protein
LVLELDDEDDGVGVLTGQSYFLPLCLCSLYVSPLILLFFAWFLFASLVLPVFLIVCLVMELDEEDNSEGVLTGQS